MKLSTHQLIYKGDELVLSITENNVFLFNKFEQSHKELKAENQKTNRNTFFDTPLSLEEEWMLGLTSLEV